MNTASARTRLGLEILGTALLLGITGDALLRAMPWGLNALLCAVAFVCCGAWLVRHNAITVSRDALWLAAGALLIASNFVARASVTLHALDVIGLAIVLAVASWSVRGVALRGRQVWHYARAGVEAALAACVGVFPLVGCDVNWSELQGAGRFARARSVALGGAVAFPLLIVFGGLFARADAVFGGLVERLFALDFGALVSHTLLTGLFAVLAAGYFWGALLRSRPRGPAPQRPGMSVSVVPVATALGLVDCLFLIFVAVQIRYLFGGVGLVASVTGLTYAEYARRGFFELVTASALVLPLLAGADWLVRDESREHQRTFRGLAYLLLLLLAAVMASALERMRLYVGAFGLSEIRLYATAFMLYLAGVSAWFAWTSLRGRRRRFAFGALVQGFAVLGGLHLINPDALIARTNLARAPAARPFDGWYAASLSADAVPVLLDAFPRLDARARCSVGAGLLEQRRRLERDGWRSWNLARARARRLLRGDWRDWQLASCS
jgi:uncharacterized protein DUF4153